MINGISHTSDSYDCLNVFHMEALRKISPSRKKHITFLLASVCSDWLIQAWSVIFFFFSASSLFLMKSTIDLKVRDANPEETGSIPGPTNKKLIT